MGLPTPNIFAGEHNFHSRLEWVSVRDMEKAVEVIVHLCRLWEEEGQDAVARMIFFGPRHLVFDLWRDSPWNVFKRCSAEASVSRSALSCRWRCSALFVTLYSALTAHHEMTLIRGGNKAAALLLGGAVVGFVIPMAKA